MGSAFNLTGNYYTFNYSKNAQEADCKALENDWGVVGKDITKVMKANPSSNFILSSH